VKQVFLQPADFYSPNRSKRAEAASYSQTAENRQGGIDLFSYTFSLFNTSDQQKFI
jgi:hypothetical protein